jgi:hypothetical protein
LAESTTPLVQGSPAGRGLGRTLRRDAWWTEAIPVIILLGGFGVYATYRAFEGKFFWTDPYLSPFYSPLLNFGWWHWSPALLILAFPLGFRVTCYYYRKAYYRAFFMDPPACAVSERPHRNYRGETSFPFILQNIHRYFLYGAIVFLCFLWYDAIRAFWFPGPDQKLHFGIGVGTLVLLVNIIFLTLYLFSCHSLRHLLGGKLDCFSCSAFNRSRHGVWKKASFLNEHHMLFAWISLITVGFADFYVRMVSSGMIKDLRIL